MGRMGRTLSHLTKARALIEQGWCKGYYNQNQGDGKTAFCAVGALYELRIPYEAEVDCRRALAACLPPGYDGQIPRFNDAPKTTKDDVLALYDCAIERAAP